MLHRLMRDSSMQSTRDFYASVDDVLHDAIGKLDQTRPDATGPGGTGGGTAAPPAGDALARAVSRLV